MLKLGGLSTSITTQGRRHRCGHGRTTFSLNLVFLIRGQRARRFALVRYRIGKYIRTHVVRSWSDIMAIKPKGIST